MGENTKNVGLLSRSGNRNLYREWELRRMNQEYRRLEQGGVVRVIGWCQPKLPQATPTNKGE